MPPSLRDLHAFLFDVVLKIPIYLLPARSPFPRYSSIRFVVILRVPNLVVCPWATQTLMALDTERQPFKPHGLRLHHVCSDSLPAFKLGGVASEWEVRDRTGPLSIKNRSADTLAQPPTTNQHHKPPWIISTIFELEILRHPKANSSQPPN